MLLNYCLFFLTLQSYNHFLYYNGNGNICRRFVAKNSNVFYSLDIEIKRFVHLGVIEIMFGFCNGSKNVFFENLSDN